MEVFERDPVIRGSQLRILSWRREGHLILLKIEKRAQSNICQYEQSEKRLDEGAQEFCCLSGEDATCLHLMSDHYYKNHGQVYHRGVYYTASQVFRGGLRQFSHVIKQESP